MNIFAKVTRETLKKNRVRTIVTIIGIILSTAMFTAVTTSIVSIQSYMKECTIYSVGNWHGGWINMPADQLEDFKQNEDVESMALAQNIGYADIGSRNEYKPYLFVMGTDDLFLERMPIHLTQGRLPDNSNEIILPDHLFENGGVEHHTGDRLTLELGDRYWEDRRLDQSMGYSPEDEESSGETLKVRETRNYTVVGFYERPDFEDYEAPGYTAITLWDDSRPSGTIASYFRMKDPRKAILFASESDDSMVFLNSNLLRYEGASSHGTFYAVLYSMAAILMGLIMFGSVSLIYNAFSISVSDRTRQFGLLSSVGATKKQIRKMVFAEASYVGIPGIILGILSGILGIGITFYCVGSKFYVVYGIEEVSLKLVVSPGSIICAAVIAYLTVLISAWIPSRRATRVTAMDAIRQSQDIQIRAEQVKTPSVVLKLFGLEGTLAQKHFRRNRRRYRATIFSLFASVVLFISTSSYCSYLNDMVSGVYETYDYDIRCEWTDFGEEEDDFPTLEQGAAILGQTGGVTRCSYAKEYWTNLDLSYEQIPEDSRERIRAGRDESKTFCSMNMILYGVDSDSFDTWLKELGLSRGDYHDPAHPLGIVMAQTQSFNSETQRYEKVTMLKPEIRSLSVPILDREKWEKWMNSLESDNVEGEDFEKKQREFCEYLDVEIGAYAESLPFGLNRSFSDCIYLVYPMEILDSMETFTAGESMSELIYFKTTDHRTAMENLSETADNNGIPSDWLTDVYENSDNEKNLVTIINVFSYGFIILISLISLANVFNTISTGILLRRREFAMLRSVGMTEKGFRKMLSYECILYGFRSLILGIPASFFITWLIFRSVMSGYDTNFYLPWTAVAIAAGSVFLVVFSTMVYAMSKVKKENLIDDLKNENY